MRPPGHTAHHHLSEGGNPGKELGHEPDPQVGKSGDIDGCEEEEQGNQGNNSGTWEQDDISPHNGSDRSAGTQGRDHAVGYGGKLHQTGSNTPEQVEYQESYRSHSIFDIITEYDQDPHIAEKMHPTTVHEHAGEQCDHPPQRKGAPGCRGESKIIDKPLKLDIVQQQLEQEHQCVRCYDQPGNDRHMA